MLLQNRKSVGPFPAQFSRAYFLSEFSDLIGKLCAGLSVRSLLADLRIAPAIILRHTRDIAGGGTSDVAKGCPSPRGWNRRTPSHRLQLIRLRVVTELASEGIRDDLAAWGHPLRLGRPDLAYPSGRLRIDVRRNQPIGPLHHFDSRRTLSSRRRPRLDSDLASILPHSLGRFIRGQHGRLRGMHQHAIDSSLVAGIIRKPAGLLGSVQEI